MFKFDLKEPTGTLLSNIFKLFEKTYTVVKYYTHSKRFSYLFKLVSKH